MKFTLKELERIMIIARMISMYYADEEITTINFRDHQSGATDEEVVFEHSGHVWLIESDQFRRGCSPVTIFDEAKKVRVK